MASVTFTPDVGGSGLTVTDDRNPVTGLANGGHRARFVPALSQVVAVASHVVDTAQDVNDNKLESQQAVTDAQQAVTDAQQAVTDAQGQVVLAGNQVTLAATQAGIATTKAGEASASALAASNSATAASNSADEAEHWAGQAGSAVSGTSVKVSANDTIAGTLDVKFVAGNNVTLTVLNSGGNEQLEIKSTGGGVALSGDIDVYVTQVKAYTISDYNAFSVYGVSVTAGTASITEDEITFNAPSSAQSITLTVTKDGTDFDFTIDVQSNGVQTPSNLSPTNGATDQHSSVTLTASAFQWLGLSDTHASSDWQVSTDAGFSTLIANVTGDTVNKTSYTVSGLSTSQTYYWRVRYTGTNNGTSGWSTPTAFVTRAIFSGAIGTQGGQGFGVGVYPSTLPSGFSNMTGNTDPSSANYGNYQYSDGSVMVFVPKFFYRIGHASSPRYATYGLNAVDIVGIETFTTEAEANAAGYALHRAFIDGGVEKSGFFIDKYLCSKNGTTSCKSVANGNPISLTTATSYNPSSDMTGCTGILADAVVLARSRGAGTFNVASVFMYSALALLSLAHAQASTSTTHCAWYDATNNFPKGCNTSLKDTNDASVTFTSAGVSGDNKPLTGSGNPLAKTTHNGQSCGVADVNGVMSQTMLGLTSHGSSATDTAVITNGNAYVLKRSVSLSSLTGGWNGTNDAWGDATNLANKYDLVTGLFPWGSATGWVYFGNGGTQVFSGAANGVSYNRTACGIQDATSGASASGTNQFGADGCYQNNCANLFPVATGNWNSAANAGVFCRYWSYYRSDVSYFVGFRAAAYGL